MKESFEDKMTLKIKKALEDFEVKYTQADWEKFELLLPQMKAPFWKRFLNKYFFYVSSSIAFSVLIFILINNFKTVDVIIKNPSITQSADFRGEFPLDDLETETFPLKSSISSPVKKNSHNSTNLKLNSIFENISENTEEFTNRDRYNINEIKAINCILIKSDLDCVTVNSEKLIKIPTIRNKVIVLENDTFNKEKDQKKPNKTFSGSGNSKIQFQKFGRFIGPNKLSLLYSPELHSSKNYRFHGFAQGIFFEMEGPLIANYSISSGINYLSNNYSIEKKGATQVYEWNDKTLPNFTQGFQYTVIDPETPYTNSIQYSLLEIPIWLKRNLWQNEKITLSANVGISAIFFLNEKYKFGYWKADDKKYVVLFDWSYKTLENIYPLASFNAGFNYVYKLNKRFTFNSGFNYKLHLISSGGNNLNLNRINVNMGIGYHLGKLK